MRKFLLASSCLTLLAFATYPNLTLAACSSTTLGAGDTATCSGVETTGITGGVGTQTINADATAILSGGISLGDDADQINNLGQITGATNLGSGNDILDNDGTITSTVSTSDGDDTIENSGTIEGTIDLGTSVNSDYLTNRTSAGTAVIGTVGNSSDIIMGAAGTQNIGNYGTIHGGISLGSGNDDVTNDGNIHGAVNLGSGEMSGRDELNNSFGALIGAAVAPATLENLVVGGNGVQNVVNNGTINGHISLGSGDDLFSNNNAIVAGNVNLGDGSDIVQLRGGTTFQIGGALDLGEGADTLEITTDDIDIVGGVIAGNDGATDTLYLEGSGDFATLIANTHANLDQTSGFEALIVDTSGTWTMNNTVNLSYSDSVTVQNGILDLDGTISTTNVGIMANGTLSGSGTTNFTGNLDNAGTISGGALNGDASVNTVTNSGTIETGVTINLLDGNDVFTNTGTLDAGSVINMGAGSDTFTSTGTFNGLVNLGDDDDVFEFDGIAFGGRILGGNHNLGDTLRADGSTLVGTGVVDDANFVEFEILDINQGDWRITGTHTFSGGSTISAGNLSLEGALTSSLSMQSGTSLTVSGTLNGNMTGDGGVQTVSLTNTGTVNGGLSFGACNDFLTLTTGSNVTGTMDGGADIDRLTLNGSGTSTLFSDVINFEGLTVDGTGTWIINNDYTFTDGTTIAGGTLQLNATLTSDVTVNSGAALSGSGGVDGNLDNSGTITATLTGGAGDDTFVNQAGGIIAVGSNINLGAGSDTFTNLGTLNGTVNLGDGDDIQIYDTSHPVFTGVISGGGHTVGDTLILTGTGASSISSSQFIEFEELNVNGGVWDTLDPMVFINGIDINNGGTLDLGGDITGDVVVNTGGTLSGGPSVTITGDLTNNGTVEPGGDGTIGTINVTGDLVLGNSGTLIVDVNASESDAIVVTGTATIDGTLIVDPDGNLAFGTTYEIIQATGGFTGTFDTATGLNGVNFSVDYSDPNAVSIVILDDFFGPTGATGLTQNQMSVATNVAAWSGSITSGDLFVAMGVLSGLNTPGTFSSYLQALDSLHPEFDDSSTQAALNSTQRFSNGMRAAMSSCDVQERTLTDPVLPCNGRDPGSSQLWVQQSGSLFDHDPDYGNIAYDGWDWQTQVGLDFQATDMVRLGLSGAFGQTISDVANLGETKYSAWDVGAYGRLDLIEVDGMKLFLGAMGSYSMGNHDNRRTLTAFSQVADSDFDSSGYSGTVLAGYATEYRGIEYGGSVGYRYGQTEIDGFTETGAGGLNLVVQGQEVEHSAVFAEFSIGRRLRLSEDTYLTPQVSVGYEGRMGDIDRSIVSRFEGAPAGSPNFTVYGQEADQFFTVAGSLDYQVVAGMKSFAGAKAGFGEDTMSYDLSAGIRLEF